MNIAKTVTGEEIILAVEGRVDTVNSKELEDAIIDAFRSTRNLVLDFEKVTYIASAGLRALLLGHKTAVSKSGVMELVHVGEGVMDVLRITGFHTTFHIR